MAKCKHITTEIYRGKTVRERCGRTALKAREYCWQHTADYQPPSQRLRAENAELREYVAFFNSLVQDRNIGKPGANRPSLRAYMEELEAENAKLKEWIRYVIRRECWGCYQVDGPTSQRKAMELGLLERHTIGPDEAEEYAGSGFRPGDSIYRFSPILAED